MPDAHDHDGALPPVERLFSTELMERRRRPLSLSALDRQLGEFLVARCREAKDDSDWHETVARAVGQTCRALSRAADLAFPTDREARSAGHGRRLPLSFDGALAMVLSSQDLDWLIGMRIDPSVTLWRAEGVLQILEPGPGVLDEEGISDRVAVVWKRQTEVVLRRAGGYAGALGSRAVFRKATPRTAYWVARTAEEQRAPRRELPVDPTRLLWRMDLG